MDQKVNTTSITSLPDEIIAMILKNNNCVEIMRFGSTCKQFYNLVHNYQLLWKDKFKELIPINIYHHIINNDSDSNWFQELIIFNELKKRVYKELLMMSPKYYWQRNEISFEEVNIFFEIALTNRFSYYYTIYILQELIRIGYNNINQFIGIKPYTLTEIYYAKLILRHLISTYLTVKWIQHFVNNDLHPEFVLNFFVQWADAMNMHPQEEVETIILNLVTEVEKVLVKQPTTECKPGDTIKNMCQKGQISEHKILAAVTQVIYHQQLMDVESNANLESLDIVKVMTNKCGHVLVYGVIYQAVAKRCGVYCNLATFPNHLFLQWTDTSDTRHQQKYTINLENGELQPRRSCPFSGHGVTPDYQYSPKSLLQYVAAIYKRTIRYDKWNMENALYLEDFMDLDAKRNPYNNFLILLLDNAHQSTVTTPIDIINFKDMNRQIISLLSEHGRVCTQTRPKRRNITVKRRDNRVEFPVGAVCYNRKNEYGCVIRGWDLSCQPQLKRVSETNYLEDGLDQPFYHVVSWDETKKYAAQENLVLEIDTFFKNLVDMLAKEFTHYDGFSFVPNDEKRAEYPEDSAVVSVLRNRYFNPRREANN